jgi:K(+)-stimulated pyrophosphate-energized sodium pump
MRDLPFLKLSAATAVVALLVVLYLARYVLKQSPGTELMARLSRQVQLGAFAFLRREYTCVFALSLMVMLFLTLVGLYNPSFGLNWKTAVAFAAGALASGCAGFLGMFIATRANARTTEAARVRGASGARSVATSGGAVMGFGVVGIALLGLVLTYRIFDGNTAIVNGYAMGASLVALFGRSGGGIFTKGADMAADLVGKLESGIPEDDPRNPAVIADNVGDNVGDVAGLGADLLESYVESIIACLAIGAIIVAGGGPIYLIAFPFVIASVGILASLAGLLYIRCAADIRPERVLMSGTYISAAVAVAGVAAYAALSGVPFTFDGITYAWWGPLAACAIGIAAGGVVGFVSDYYTSSAFAPVRRMALRCETGPATAVVEGLAIGMQSTALPVLVLALAILAAHHCCGIYGVAMAALGMLATTGMVVAVDAYGPIADNAGGIAEMAALDPSVREITDNLDAVGNSTAAIGKGFAIGSAAFAAIGLLSAYIMAMDVALLRAGGGEGLVLSLGDPVVLAGLLIGAMLPFWFSSMLFHAVSTCANTMILEVRRQFAEIPGLREGKEGVRPDSARCVDIATRDALRGMLLPGTLSVVLPVVIGLMLGPEALAGLLVGAIATGVMLGIQAANSGGALDNAKKYIEAGHHGGKNSPAHQAAIVGDTVGDPLKDTVGPSVNILIKLMCVIALVLAPLFVG